MATSHEYCVEINNGLSKYCSALVLVTLVATSYHRKPKKCLAWFIFGIANWLVVKQAIIDLHDELLLVCNKYMTCGVVDARELDESCWAISVHLIVCMICREPY